MDPLRHQLPALLQIRQHPPPQGEPGQLPLLQQAGQHAEQAPPGQLGGELGQASGQAAPFVLAGFGNLGRTPAQQGRCGQQPQPLGPAGLGQGIQQPLQGSGTGTFKHIPLAHQPAGDATGFEGAPQGFGLAVGAHQQADGVGVQAPLEQGRDEAGDLAGQLALQAAAAWRFLPGPALAAKPEQLQGRLPLRQHQAAPGHFGLHRGYGQAAAAQARPHQPVEACDQGLAGAVVVGEAADAAPGDGGLAGPQVGGQFAAAKAIDRLLGITHQHQPVPAGLERPREDSPLDRVGVLKLIDQGHGVALPHHLQKGGAGLLTWIEALQQLGETEPATLAAAPVQLGPAPVAGMQQQGLRRPVQHLGDCLQQGALRQGWPLPFDAASQLEEGTWVEVVAQQPPCAAAAAGRGPIVTAAGLGGDPAVHQAATVLGRSGAVGSGGFNSQGAPLAGGAAESGLQGAAMVAPEPLKATPGPSPEGFELGGQGAISIDFRRQGLELEGRVAIELAQQALQPLRATQPLLQPGQQGAFQGQHLALPVVVGHLAHQGAVVAFELELRGQASLQGLALQAAAAEAMDGGDVGGIELLEGEQQPGPQGSRPGPLPLQPLGQGGIGGLQRRIIQTGQGQLQPLADAVPQFGGGGIGEGHHEQLTQTQLGLGHVAQHQLGQGEGLAGAGTGLEQADARIQREGIGLKGLLGQGRQRRHGSCWRRGASSSSAWAATTPLASRLAPLRSLPKQRACSGSWRSPRSWPGPRWLEPSQVWMACSGPFSSRAQPVSGGTGQQRWRHCCRRASRRCSSRWAKSLSGASRRSATPKSRSPRATTTPPLGAWPAAAASSSASHSSSRWRLRGLAVCSTSREEPRHSSS